VLGSERPDVFSSDIDGKPEFMSQPDDKTLVLVRRAAETVVEMGNRDPELILPESSKRASVAPSNRRRPSKRQGPYPLP